MRFEVTNNLETFALLKWEFNQREDFTVVDNKTDYYLTAGNSRLITFRIRSNNNERVSGDTVANLVKITVTKENTDEQVLEGYVDASVNENVVKKFVISSSESSDKGRFVYIFMRG